MKRFYSLLLLVLMLVGVGMSADAQMQNPIRWKTSVKMNKEGTEGVMKFDATIDAGWHLYGLSIPDGGPGATKFDFKTLQGVKLKGGIKPSKAPIKKYEEMFEMELQWWVNSVSFTQAFTVTGKDGYKIEGLVRYQGCNDENCIPPSKELFEFAGGAPAVQEENPSVAEEEEKAVAAGDTVAADSLQALQDTIAAPVPATNPADETGWWKPVTYPEGDSASEDMADKSIWYIIAMGFIAGLLAVLTPCVWPLIPMTVSFFMKRSGDKKKAVHDAIIYGISIIVIYTLLGVAITVIFGASKLNDLSTNALFNLLFFLLLLVFAISFMGAFDITLPSSWSNKMDSKVESSAGLISIFFMAFTLSLVSFSCTGPIIGTLLVEAAQQGNIVGPALGMASFAFAMAIPFSLFAMFPQRLKAMPKSGGWLNSVKVVLGFLELVLSLKFLSVADLAYGWHILDREVFISLWVVLFALLGMYLLGKIMFSHDTPIEYVSMPRFFMALISFGFAIYLIPGLWGAPLKSVSAFVPPLYTQDFNLYAGGQFKEFDDYEEGMKYAADNHRPVLIDFTGYGCVNCRKMDAAVFDTQEVSGIITENYVMIKLYVDEKKELDKPYTVEENGKKVLIETVGDKWSYLQRSKFGANAQPFYVLLDNEGTALKGSRSYDENVAAFAAWLSEGAAKYAGTKP